MPWALAVALVPEGVRQGVPVQRGRPAPRTHLLTPRRPPRANPILDCTLLPAYQLQSGAMACPLPPNYSCTNIVIALPYQGPAIPMFRRHTKGDSEIHFEPALRVVSGNYVTAKRRGVLEGVDFGLTGEVGARRAVLIRHADLLLSLETYNGTC